MTDINAAAMGFGDPAPSAPSAPPQAQATPPVPVSPPPASQAPPAPQRDGATPERVNEIAEWMRADPFAAEKSAAPAPAVTPPAAAQPAPAAGTPVPDAATPPAPTPPSADEMVALMYAPPTAADAPAATPAPSADAPAPPAFAPFGQTVAVPDNVMQALFDNPDAGSRNEVFKALLASTANAAARAAVDEVKRNTLPAAMNAQATQTREAQQQDAIRTDFYKSFPDLVKAPPQLDLVKRAAQVVADQERMAGRGFAYNEQTKQRIGALAQATLNQMRAAMGVPAPSVGAAPQGTPPAMFDPSAGRPAGYGGGSAAPTPESELAFMQAW